MRDPVPLPADRRRGRHHVASRPLYETVVERRGRPLHATGRPADGECRKERAAEPQVSGTPGVSRQAHRRACADTPPPPSARVKSRSGAALRVIYRGSVHRGSVRQARRADCAACATADCSAGPVRDPRSRSCPSSRPFPALRAPSVPVAPRAMSHRPRLGRPRPAASWLTRTPGRLSSFGTGLLLLGTVSRSPWCFSRSCSPFSAPPQGQR